MDKSDIGIAATMGMATVQAYTTFLGSVNTSDMLDGPDYRRGLGMALGWSFLGSVGLAGFTNSYAPFIAWVIAGGAMLGAYEYHRESAYGGQS